MTLSSGKDWNGSIFPAKGRGPFTVKFRRYENRHKRNPWSKREGFKTKTAANTFLRAAKADYDKKAAGLFDPHAEQRERPIDEHLDDFIEHVRSGLRRRVRKQGDKHVKLVTARLKKAFKRMRATSIADVTLDRATRFLNGLLDGGATVKTRNEYASLLKQFGRWLEEGDRALKNPVVALRRTPSEQRQHRQALTPEGVNQLAKAAIQRTLQSRARPANIEKHMEIARRRALTVVIAFLAGLRNNELANLRWGMISDETIDLPAEITKTGTQQSVPLHDGLRDLLRDVRRHRGVQAGKPVHDDELVVGYPDPSGYPTLPRHLAARIRDDAKWAKLPVVDHAGRRLDLHAMRTSLANALDEAVPDGIVAAILRHTPGGVTRKHYRRTDAAKLRQFINEIPAAIATVEGLIPDSESRPNSRPYSQRTGDPQSGSVRERSAG